MTDPQAERIYSMLTQGFGVEDIAIKTGLPVAEIREEVKALRRHHQLAAVLSEGRRK